MPAGPKAECVDLAHRLGRDFDRLLDADEAAGPRVEGGLRRIGLRGDAGLGGVDAVEVVHAADVEHADLVVDQVLLRPAWSA